MATSSMAAGRPPARPTFAAAERPPDPHQRPGHGGLGAQVAAWQFMPDRAGWWLADRGRSGRLQRRATFPDAIGGCLRSLTGSQRRRSRDPQTSRPQVGRPPPARRRWIDRAKLVPVGESLLGRVLDGAGRPLDRLGPLHATLCARLQSRPVNPMSRAPIDETLDVGVRAINALLCVGRGQRMGLLPDRESARASCSA
jgi:hypothetical protein